MSEGGLLNPIGFTVEVKISKVDGNKASIVVPGEIRLTRNLLNYINLALAERGLELAHMEITEEHRKELENLPNVVIQEETDK
jgi:hypothetical protein